MKPSSRTLFHPLIRPARIVWLFLIVVLTGPAGAFPPEALVDSRHWELPDFKSQFRPGNPNSHISHRRWPVTNPIFGVNPHVITAKFEGDRIKSINLLFLDSGTHFGYISRAAARDFEKENREEFQKYFARIKAQVRDGLLRLSAPNHQAAVIGEERMLKQTVGFFNTGDLVARFHAIDEQLVKVTFFRTIEEARHWIPPDVVELRPRDRAPLFEKKVIKQPNGDVMISDVPLLPQGDRAYCGISALAMAMQYLGLEIDTEDYAAAAGVRYGSTRGSRIREVYAEAAEEAGFRMSRTTRFDFNKTRQSIDRGIPVLVWRRWNQERDFLHTAFAKRYQRDPAAKLPEPNAADRDTWPGKNSFTHATVITGYNQERREVIFTESWSERERNRRMRIEEMEGTAYYTFFLRM